MQRSQFVEGRRRSCEEPPRLGLAVAYLGRRAVAGERLVLEDVVVRLAVGYIGDLELVAPRPRPLAVDVAEEPLAVAGPVDLDPASDSRVRSDGRGLEPRQERRRRSQP